MNAIIIGMPRPALPAPPIAAISRTWRRGLRADAVDHAHRERGLRPVGAHLQRLDVLVAVQPSLEAAPAVTDAVEDEHPPAAQSECGAVARVVVQRHEDPDAEDE